MAKIKLSSVGITNISGKAGGSVYSRNRGGAYVKNFVMPSNTISEARQIVRAIFGVIAGLWRNLTNTQRQSFTDQAPFYPTIDVFGDTKVLSGNALHQKLNTQLLNADLPPIQAAIPPMGTNPVISNIIPAGVNITTGEMVVEFGLNEDNATANNEYVLEATRPHSASVKAVKNLFRKFLTTAGPDGDTPDTDVVDSLDFSTTQQTMYTAYASQFGAPSEGDVIDVRIKAINPVTGEESAYWYGNLVVTA